MKHLILTIVILSLLLGCATTDTNVPAIKPVAATVTQKLPEQSDYVPTTPLCNEEHPENTVGLKLCRGEVYPGFILYAPLSVPKAYLINPFGEMLHQWNLTTKPSGVVYLLNNGLLLATGKHETGSKKLDNGGPNTGGIIQMLDWDSKVVWDFRYADDNRRAHHDIHMMPNGNILIIAWEPKTKEEAIAAGRNPELVHEKGFMPDHIVEIKPTSNGGDIVWEWHAWDHLVQNFDPKKPNYGNPKEHPELINLNTRFVKTPSWNHINSIDYNEKLDQILLSVNSFSEIWIIDHSTTTAEAASHSGGRWGRGGDLLYRWGNPQAYGAGTAEDQVLFYQHNAQWIRDGLPGEGHILVFNNGRFRKDGLYSSVDELAPGVDQSGRYLLNNGRFTPEGLFWSYKAAKPEEFFSERISSAQRLPNGNTFVCSGDNGTMFEVTPLGNKLWEYVNPVEKDRVLAQGEHPSYVDKQKDSSMRNAVFKATRIDPAHPGLKGRSLNPKGVLERSAKGV